MPEVFIEYDENSKYPSYEYSFCPNVSYPEYAFSMVSDTPNEVYEKIRNCLYHMGLDKDNFGTKEWNPLGKYIKPGHNVLIKPNWVMHFNGNSKVEKNAMECLVTHPSCLRAICDYCLIALKGKGKVLIADAPMQDCDLDILLEKFHYNDILKFYQKNKQQVSFMDLRKYRSVFNKNFVIVDQIMQSGEGVDVDLSRLSIHEKRIGARQYQVDNYDYDDTEAYHSSKKHIYSINKEVLKANVIINFCKPKSHRLAGFTAAMKNMVGISYNKASLPHRTANSIEEGGDAYPEKNGIKKMIDIILEDKIKSEKQHKYIKATIDRYIYGGLLIFERRFGRNPYVKGIWYGNDTIWRTVVDLNYIVRHADADGKIHEKNQRTVLNFGDMIIAGDHNGPCQPDPKTLGMLIASDDERAFDVVFSKLAGFDDENIPMVKGIKNGLTDYMFGELTAVNVSVNGVSKGDLNEFVPLYEWKFKPHDAWQCIDKRAHERRRV